MLGRVRGEAYGEVHVVGFAMRFEQVGFEFVELCRGVIDWKKVRLWIVGK